MRFWEAIRELENGKRIRLISWIGKTAYMDSASFAEDMSGVPANQLQNYLDSEWEAYEEPGLSFQYVVKGLIEGKKFKRKIWDSLSYPVAWNGSYPIVENPLQNEFLFTLSDFDAIDWFELK